MSIAGARGSRDLGPPAGPLLRSTVGSPAPSWQEASPAWLAGALERSQARASGGWYVVEASRAIGARPRACRIEGRSLVAWRCQGRPLVAPDRCPHLGAQLSRGHAEDGELVCPWHGLRLGRLPRGTWQPLPAHDDGVLLWVRLDGRAGEPPEAPTERPILAVRPTAFVEAIHRLEARCDPRDVIANRLDPWHGVHLHPYSFSRVQVLEQLPDEVTVRVTFRLAWRAGIEIDARFHSPEPRTIVMTIVSGVGAGSVVETHATPLEAGRTLIHEAVLASLPASGAARTALAAGAALWRPLLRRAAGRLWRDDAPYAERLFELRR